VYAQGSNMGQNISNWGIDMGLGQNDKPADAKD
jgi:hypothetical protein